MRNKESTWNGLTPQTGSRMGASNGKSSNHVTTLIVPDGFWKQTSSSLRDWRLVPIRFGGEAQVPVNLVLVSSWAWTSQQMELSQSMGLSSRRIVSWWMLKSESKISASSPTRLLTCRSSWRSWSSPENDACPIDSKPFEERLSTSSEARPSNMPKVEDHLIV